MKKHKRFRIFLGVVTLIIILLIGIQSVSALGQTIHKRQRLNELKHPIEETHEAYTQRASEYSNLGEQELAISDFNKAIELHPTECPGIYQGLGLAYARQGAYEKAFLAFEKAVKVDPNVAGVYSAQADTYLELGDTASALASYDKAIELDPTWPWYYHSRGYVHVQEGNHSLAKADFEEAVRLDPNNSRFYHSLAWINRLQGNWEGAVNNYLLSKVKEVNHLTQQE